MRMIMVRASESEFSVLSDRSDGLRTVTFVVEEKPHSRFERIDDDLHIKLNLSLSQALLGPDGGGEITKEVEQLDGRRIQVTAPSGVSLTICVR